MATIITLPNIVGLDKELCVPEGNQRLWNYFTVDHYTSSCISFKLGQINAKM